MALTKVTGGVVSPSSDYAINNVTGVAATFTGNVSIGGTLTYQDVSNIDAVGIVTAQAGIHFGIGATVGKVDTATGITTFSSSVGIADSIFHVGDTDTSIRFPAADTITAETGGSERLRIDPNGHVTLGIGVSANNNAYLTIPRLSTDGNAIELHSLRNDTAPADLAFYKNRSTSYGSYTATQSGDTIMSIASYVSTGSAYALRGMHQTYLSGTGIDYAWKTSSSSEKMRLLQNGNLGIGSVSPGRPLTITHTDPRIRLQDSDSGGHAEIYTDNNNDLHLTADSSSSAGSSKIIFNVDGTNEKMRITNTGRLGIGTGSPLGVAHVNVGGGSTEPFVIERSGSGESIWSMKPYAGNLYFRGGPAVSNYTSDRFAILYGGNNAYGGDVQFFGTAAGITSCVWDASANKLIFKDNSKLVLGDGEDFTMYHDGSGNSILQDDNNLYIKGNSVYIQANQSEPSAYFNYNGAVKLYYDGGTYSTAKLETTATGVTVDGKLRIDIATGGTVGSGNAEGIFLRNTQETDNNAVTIFGGADDYNNAASAINFVNVDHSANHGDISFDTRGLGGYGERLRLTGTGQLHVGNATNNAINNALFKAVADDGEADELYVGQFINKEATAGHSFGVNIQAGSNYEDHGFRVKNRANDTTQFIVIGDGEVGVNTTDPRFNNGSSHANNGFHHLDTKFGVKGSIAIGNLSATATDERELAFYRRGGPAPGTSMSTHKMGRIAWYGSSNDTALPDKAYSISCVPNGGGWTAGTNRRASITFNNHDSQVMRLTSTGNVLVGDHTSPLTNYQSNQTRLSIYDSASSGGYLELGGNNPNNSHSSGTILFINNNNADADNNDADGKILAMQRVENVTTDSNAGDDMGGDLNFMTKPDGGGLDERFRIKDVGRIDIRGESGQTGFHLSNRYGQAGVFGGMYYDGSAWVRSAAGSRKGAGMYVNTGGSIGFVFASENSGTSATMKEFVSLGEVHQNSGGITINGDASSTAGPIITLQDNVSTGTPSSTIMATSVGGLIINADAGNDVNGSYIQFKQDNENKWLMQDNDFKSSVNGITEPAAALLGSYHSENNTNHDGTVDCTAIKCNTFGILEVFGRVNPNTSGSGAYSDPIHMYIYHGIGWNGAVTSFIYCRHVAPPARDAFSSGTGANGNNISVVWYDGSSETTECSSNSSSHYVRFKLHGFNPTHGPNFAIRVFKRF